MNLYLVTARLPKRDVLRWCGSQTEVRAAQKELRERYGKQVSLDLEEIALPWYKADIIKFFNQRFHEKVKRDEN